MLEGISILDNESHPTNASPPILVTLDGIFMLVIFLQSIKAFLCILLTPSGIKELLQPYKKSFVNESIIALQLF